MLLSGPNMHKCQVVAVTRGGVENWLYVAAHAYLRASLDSCDLVLPTHVDKGQPSWQPVHDVFQLPTSVRLRVVSVANKRTVVVDRMEVDWDLKRRASSVFGNWRTVWQQGFSTLFSHPSNLTASWMRYVQWDSTVASVHLRSNPNSGRMSRYANRSYMCTQNDAAIRCATMAIEPFRSVVLFSDSVPFARSMQRMLSHCPSVRHEDDFIRAHQHSNRGGQYNALRLWSLFAHSGQRVCAHGRASK